MKKVLSLIMVGIVALSMMTCGDKSAEVDEALKNEYLTMAQSYHDVKEMIAENDNLAKDEEITKAMDGILKLMEKVDEELKNTKEFTEENVFKLQLSIGLANKQIEELKTKIEV